ncbi:hypothetical protein NSS69_10125 [Macrococcus sp. FSL W8-0367]
MMTCTNDPTQDLKQVIKFYEYLKAERDHLEMIVSETIHYLVKQVVLYESEGCDREVKVLNDVINNMKDIEKENKL